MRFDMKKESPSMCINLNMLVICLYIKKWWVVFSIPRLKQYKLFVQGKQLLFSDYDIYSRLFNFYQGRSLLSINPGNSQDLTTDQNPVPRIVNELIGNLEYFDQHKKGECG